MSYLFDRDENETKSQQPATDSTNSATTDDAKQMDKNQAPSSVTGIADKVEIKLQDDHSIDNDVKH